MTRAKTRSGPPSRRSNADPKKKNCFTLYFYKTFGGRTEIRLFKKRLDPRTGRWKTTDKGEIHKSRKSATDRVAALLESWD